jgi:hypothetical protein
MIKYLLSVVVLSGIFLSGCASTANLTTTQGSTAATVDNPSGISAGASVSSTDTAVGTVVGSINGSNLIIAPAATATGTVSAKFTPSLAVDLQETGNLASDTETDLLAGAAAYNDFQAALSGAQQSMGGHGISINNIGQYAQAANASAATSGLNNAIAVVTADVTQQLAQGLTPTKISQNVAAAQTNLPVAP